MSWYINFGCLFIKHSARDTLAYIQRSSSLFKSPAVVTESQICGEYGVQGCSMNLFAILLKYLLTASVVNVLVENLFLGIINVGETIRALQMETRL